MEKHIIHLVPLGKTISVNHQIRLIDVLDEFGVEFPCGGKGTCGKCKVKVLHGDLRISEKHGQRLNKLGLSNEWRLACMSECTGDITLEVDQMHHLILADESDFDFIPQEGYGVAVDLGTTTLVAQLLDLSTAAVMAVESMLNPQIKYGADIISRIQACLNGHADDLAQSIRQAVGSMIQNLLAVHSVPLKRVNIVGNTAMQHIFCQLDVSPLSTYPFHAVDLGHKLLDPRQLNWPFEVLQGTHFYPSFGSFVGSDILAGIVATDIHHREKFTALIDLGTNGEIVIGNKEKIVCASTAAGPAFEGSNISMGMRASTGAISSVYIEDGQLQTRVIGNTTAKGLCGSALIDAVAVLHTLEKLGMFGEILSGAESIRLNDDVFLSQKDIHEFLLAKAAIAAGIEILARHIGISIHDLDAVYLSGGFGNYVNIAHVIATGLIELPEEKIHKVGNSALMGAKMLLFAHENTAKEILDLTHPVNLEADPYFQDIYVGKMMLIPAGETS
jgi:uncharacterized 2Fe-2S/4Fe-4S cluster protein (DUF4445 family)